MLEASSAQHILFHRALPPYTLGRVDGLFERVPGIKQGTVPDSEPMPLLSINRGIITLMYTRSYMDDWLTGESWHSKLGITTPFQPSIRGSRYSQARSAW